MSRPINGSDVYRAVSHPVRRRMVDLLLEDDRTVGELRDHIRIPGGTLSRHLDVLRSASVVGRRRKGRTWVCFVRRKALAGVAAWSARAAKSGHT